MKLSDKPAILQRLWVHPRGAVRARSEEGNVLFEFALALPMLSMLLVGVIYGGMTFYNYVELTNSVAAGARTLANGRAAGSNACSQATTAITNSAGNLKSSQVVTGTVSFAGSSSCSSSLVPGDAGVVSAVYPCNVPIPFTTMNLCPMSSGSSITAPWTGGPTLVSCPYSYCISATTTVYIE